MRSSLSAAERASSGLDPVDPAWSLIELAYSSVAALAIVPMQDVFGPGSEARMNTPVMVTGNWSWRLEPDAADDELAARLREAAEAAGRA